MKGAYDIRVENARVQFKLTLRRSLTVIRGASATGKGNVLTALRSHPSERVLVIADGAAFGPHMEMVLALAKRRGAGLFLPESFEHLILQSGLVRDSEVAEVLADPAAFIESRDYFSWEAFFTSLLTEKTRGTYLSYGKRKLNSAYLQPREFGAVESTLPDLGLSQSQGV